MRSLLAKGPKYRLPPNLNSNFIDRVVSNLDLFTYRLRWHETVFDRKKINNFQIPFPRNTVNMPPHMSEEKEVDLALLKKEIKEVTMNEAKRLKKCAHFRQDQDSLRETRTFAKNNELTVIQSDKTNRMVVTKQKYFDERIFAILKDENTYKPLPCSKQKNIENQANKLLRSVLKDKHFLTKKDTERFITSGSEPASFQAFIKDHKDSVDNFPLRPIASVNNTATEKVDWLISKILGQLVQHVPANVKNTEALIDELKLIKTEQFDPDFIFVSLDVVALYPSIPLDYGITAVIEFAAEHWERIDTFGLSIEELKKCLIFICYNYEIRYKDEVYLQRKGCPMGAHFAPPFAILTMHKVEIEALIKLENKLHIVPDIYKRYLDDVILGPLRHDAPLEDILRVFNSINPSIQFSLEAPKRGEPLQFLDISIFIGEKCLDYGWFSKKSHSDNTLRKDSWVSNSIKTNFVNNIKNHVNKRCSNEELQKSASNGINDRLLKMVLNGTTF